MKVERIQIRKQQIIKYLSFMESTSSNDFFQLILRAKLDEATKHHFEPTELWGDMSSYAMLSYLKMP